MHIGWDKRIGRQVYFSLVQQESQLETHCEFGISSPPGGVCLAISCTSLNNRKVLKGSFFFVWPHEPQARMNLHFPVSWPSLLRISISQWHSLFGQWRATFEVTVNQNSRSNLHPWQEAGHPEEASSLLVPLGCFKMVTTSHIGLKLCPPSWNMGRGHNREPCSKEPWMACQWSPCVSAAALRFYVHYSLQVLYLSNITRSLLNSTWAFPKSFNDVCFWTNVSQEDCQYLCCLIWPALELWFWSLCTSFQKETWGWILEYIIV